MAAAIFDQTATPRRPMATHRRPSASPPHARTRIPGNPRWICRNSYFKCEFALSLSASTSCCGTARRARAAAPAGPVPAVAGASPTPAARRAALQLPPVRALRCPTSSVKLLRCSGRRRRRAGDRVAGDRRGRRLRDAVALPAADAALPAAGLRDRAARPAPTCCLTCAPSRCSRSARPSCSPSAACSSATTRRRSTSWAAARSRRPRGPPAPSAFLASRSSRARATTTAASTYRRPPASGAPSAPRHSERAPPVSAAMWSSSRSPWPSTCGGASLYFRRLARSRRRLRGAQRVRDRAALRLAGARRLRLLGGAPPLQRLSADGDDRLGADRHERARASRAPIGIA